MKTSDHPFLKGSSTPLVVAFCGFVGAGAGGALDFAGIYFGVRPLAITGVVLAILGVLVMFGAVAAGWLQFGKQAISGSFQAARDLRVKIRDAIRRPK